MNTESDQSIKDVGFHPDEKAIEKVLAIDPEAEAKQIQQLVNAELIAGGVPEGKITAGEMRSPSVLYMIYWYNRLHNNEEEQRRIGEHLVEYIVVTIPD